MYTASADDEILCVSERVVKKDLSEKEKGSGGVFFLRRCCFTEKIEGKLIGILPAASFVTQKENYCILQSLHATTRFGTKKKNYLLSCYHTSH